MVQDPNAVFRGLRHEGKRIGVPEKPKPAPPATPEEVAAGEQIEETVETESATPETPPAAPETPPAAPETPPAAPETPPAPPEAPPAPPTPGDDSDG